MITNIRTKRIAQGKYIALPVLKWVVIKRNSEIFHIRKNWNMTSKTFLGCVLYSQIGSMLKLKYGHLKDS